MKKSSPIIIGLTGSIGMGKSTVAVQFEKCGAAACNSDLVVHHLLAKGGAAVAKVAKLFPDVQKNGAIDRAALGKKVFGNKAALKKLEAIMHPLVRKAQDDFIRKAGTKIVVLDIPLLFETGGQKRCDYVVVVTAPKAVQRERVLARKGMTEEKFTRILALQMPDAEKRNRADFIVNTGKGKRESLQQVKQIMLRLLKKDGSLKP